MKNLFLSICKTFLIMYYKKFLFYFVVSVIVIVPSSCGMSAGSQKTEKSDAEQAELKGAVRQTIDKYYVATTDSFQQVSKGKLESVYSFVYNKEGNIEESIGKLSYGDNAWISIKSVYTYGNNGKKTVIAKYDANGNPDSKEIFEYDSKGNLSKISVYNAYDVLQRESGYVYDVRNNMIEFHQSGEWGLHGFFKYDENNNCIEKTYYNPDGGLREISTLKYNDKGKIIEQQAFNADAVLVSTTTFVYDKNGNNTEMQLQTTVASDFNVNERYEYQFDKNGNWIVKTTYDSKSNKIKSITEREITYYE